MNAKDAKGITDSIARRKKALDDAKVIMQNSVLKNAKQGNTECSVHDWYAWETDYLLDIQCDMIKYAKTLGYTIIHSTDDKGNLLYYQGRTRVRGVSWG